MNQNSLYLGKTPISRRYHHGHTLNGRTCEDRWRKDSDYSKLPYFPEKVAEYPIGDLHDWDTRPYLLKDPYITSPKDQGEDIRSPEVYDVDECVENPDEYFNDAILRSIEAAGKKGAYKVLKRYKARPHQAAVCMTVQELWTGRTIVVPLNLCPRFGKDLFHFAVFDAVENSGLDTMVFCGYWLGANESIIETRKEYWDICHNIKVIKPNYDEYLEAKKNGHRIFIDQSLHVDSDTIDPRLLEKLESTPTLVVVDEADFGAWTPLSKSVLNQYVDCGDNNLVLLSTGTNIARAMIGSKENLVQEPIIVSYLDMLEEQLKGHETLEDLVKVALLKLQIPQKIINEWRNLEGEKIPTMTKIWSRRNSHIIKLMLATLFYDEEMGTDLFNLYAERYKRIDHPAFQMFVPVTKKDVDNIVAIGNKVAPHLEWVALHGDEHTNRSCEKDIQDLIDNSDKEGTVIVSCSMGARSFSVPNIIGVVNCIDGGSIGASTQRASRCLTPGCGKEYGLIVDFCFDSEKTSTFETDLLSTALDSNPSDLTSAVRRVYGLVQFLKKDDEGYLIELTESDVGSYITSDANIKEMACAEIDILGITERLSYLNSVLNGVKSNDASGFPSPIDNAKNYIPSPPKEEKEKIKEKDLKAVRVAQQVVKTSGNVYFLAPNATSFLEGLALVAADEQKNEEYKKLVGNGADVIIKDLYQHLPAKKLNIIFTRVSNSTNYEDKYFKSHLSSHSTGILNLTKLQEGSHVYGAKEPDAAVMEELEILSKDNDVTVVACNEGYIEFYKKKGYNTITISQYFSKQFNMRFTGALANPPYIKNLHLEFLLKNLQTSDYVQQVHPSGWLYRTEKKVERDVKSELKGRLKKLTIINGNTTFSGTEFQAPLVVTEAVKEHDGLIEVHYETSGNTYYIESLDDFPTGFWEPKQQHLDLIKKVKSLDGDRLRSEKCKDQKHFLKCPEISGDGRSKDPTKMCKDDFWTFFYDGSDLKGEIKKTGRCFVLNSESEVNSLRLFLRTKFARFCFSISKVTVHCYISRYLKNVPVPPLDREWDEESVYDYFNISKEDRKYIDNFIPTFYKW